MFQFNYNKKSFDVLKKTFDPEYKGEWQGTGRKMNIFYNVYLKEKYTNDLFYTPFVSLFLLPHDLIKRENAGGQQLNIVNYITNTSKPINRETLKGKELTQYIEKYKNNKKRFHFFDITMMMFSEKGEQDFHSVSALYDSDPNQIDFFNTLSGTGLKTYNKAFRLFFNEIYGKDIKLNYSPKCIRFDKLLDQCYPKYFLESNFYIDGPCAIWTLWFLELRLKNKGLSRQEVINKAMSIFKNGEYYLVCEILAGYAQFVDKITSKYTVKYDTKNQKALITYTNSEKNKRILKMILATVSLLFINRSFLYKVYKKIEK